MSDCKYTPNLKLNCHNFNCCKIKQNYMLILIDDQTKSKRFKIKRKL